MLRAELPIYHETNTPVFGQPRVQGVPFVYAVPTPGMFTDVNFQNNMCSTPTNFMNQTNSMQQSTTPENLSANTAQSNPMDMKFFEMGTPAPITPPQNGWNCPQQFMFPAQVSPTNVPLTQLPTAGSPFFAYKNNNNNNPPSKPSSSCGSDSGDSDQSGETQFMATFPMQNAAFPNAMYPTNPYMFAPAPTAVTPPIAGGEGMEPLVCAFNNMMQLSNGFAANQMPMGPMRNTTGTPTPVGTPFLVESPSGFYQVQAFQNASEPTFPNKEAGTPTSNQMQHQGPVRNRNRSNHRSGLRREKSLGQPRSHQRGPAGANKRRYGRGHRYGGKVKAGFRSKQNKICEVLDNLKRKFGSLGLLVPPNYGIRGTTVGRVHCKKRNALNKIEEACERALADSRIKTKQISTPLSMKNKFQKKGFLIYWECETEEQLGYLMDIFKSYDEVDRNGQYVYDEFQKIAVALPSTNTEEQPTQTTI